MIGVTRWRCSASCVNRHSSRGPRPNDMTAHFPGNRQPSQPYPKPTACSPRVPREPLLISGYGGPCGVATRRRRQSIPRPVNNSPAQTGWTIAIGNALLFTPSIFDSLKRILQPAESVDAHRIPLIPIGTRLHQCEMLFAFRPESSHNHGMQCRSSRTHRVRSSAKPIFRRARD